MKRFVSVRLTFALACCVFNASAYVYMTKPELGDGSSGNVLVWNISDLEYTDGHRAAINPDKTITFRNSDGVAVGNEVIWNGYTERTGFERIYPTWNDMPLGTYYFKILYKTQRINDETVTKKVEGYAAKVRLLNGKTCDFGYVVPEWDGFWQCAVIPFTVSASGQGGTEMAFWNNWQGAYFDFTIGQYAVISLDDEPLDCEYENEDGTVGLVTSEYSENERADARC